MSGYLYLIVNLGAVLIPFVYSFHPKLRFWDDIRYFVPANVLVALFFIIWDAYFTHIGIWGFNPKYLSGVYIGNLPFEEVLFFICIPYACVFSYHCFGVLMQIKNKPYTIGVSAAIILLSLVLAVLYFGRFYTTSTFVLLAVFIAYLQFIKKPQWLQQYYTTYLVMLIPFFIVNGILTGFGLDEPIVWYNAEEMINIRILTIPFEDAFYGFLLIGLNVLLFEHFRKKKPAV